MRIVVGLIVIVVILTSCKSEYEERLIEAKNLKLEMELLKNNQQLIFDDRFAEEIEDLKNKINILAKVSGDESLFLREVYEN